jgi:membrane protease YdiL (CAAX protease family)
MLTLLTLRVVWLKRTGYLVDIWFLVCYWSLVEDAAGLFIGDIQHTPYYLGSALVIFMMSTVISSGSATVIYLKKLLYIRVLKKRILLNLTIRHLLTAAYEEIVWRAVILIVIATYTNSLVAVIFGSFLFFYLHLHRFYNRPQAVEFFIFSLLLSMVYLMTNSLLHVIVIHFVRNLLISICSQGSRGEGYDEKNIHLSRTS